MGLLQPNRNIALRCVGSCRVMIFFPANVLVVYLIIMLSGTRSEVHVGGALRRPRRDWVIPAQRLRENQDYRDRKFVAKIRSDIDRQETMYYTLLGHGANKEPINLFVVEETTGLVRIRGLLDREERDVYVLTGVARYRNGTVAEESILLTIEVDDDNDNRPVFVPMPAARVIESSPPGMSLTSAL